MTKTYLKLIVAIVFASNLFAQNIPSYVPKDGLIGWWPFNGNANDESGNGYNGSIMNGVTLTADRDGTVNSAYSFNGGDSSYITVSNRFQSINANGNNGVTIAFWFYSNSSREENSDFFDFRSIDNGALEIVINSTVHEPIISNNTANLYVANFDGPTSRNAASYYASNNYITNKWNYVVVVNDFTNNSSKLYLNGNIVGQKDTILPKLFTPRLNFGSRYDFNDSKCCGFRGSLDDFGLWNRALTQEEITALYTSTPPCISPTSKITPQGNTTFCQGGFVNLKASEGDNFSYEWFNNSQLIAGATQSVYQASTNGFYTVKVKDGACSATSNSVPVTVNPNPIAKITPDGPTAFCEGGAVNLVASGGTNYKWNSGSSTSSIKVTQTGTYYVNVINSFGCSVNKSYDVNVYPNPKVVITPIPQFILHNNGSIKLTATPVGGAFKGEGVTGSSFNPSNIGLGKKTLYYNYTSTQGCSGSAQLQTIVVDSIGTKCTSYDTVTVTKTINDTVGILKIKFQLTTGIKATQFTSVSVYPNPTSDLLIIDASDVQALNGYRYKMIDISGKTVYNELVRTSKTEISLKTFGKAGVYVLHVVDANNTSIETRQIVLE